MYRVLHLIRKNTQLKASFIQNQIISHIDFDPFIIYCEERLVDGDGGFANGINRQVQIYSLSNMSGRIGKLRYKYLKLLSNSQRRSLIEVVQKIKPDVIHLHYGTDAGIFLKALRNIHIPKIVSFYGYECSGFPRRFWGLGEKYLQKRVYQYANIVFAMSPDMKKDILSTGCPAKKIKVHYYGTDVQKFYTNHNYLNSSGIKFLIISGLVPQKGHKFLLEAFSQATKTMDNNIQLTIVGAGELEQDIRKQIHALGLEKSVILPGPVVYASLKHNVFFASHDVFIHPSVTDVNGDKEGIPGAIVEAMAAGLPVISTNHAGIPYIIENEKTGILVNEWDVDALSQAIINLANSSELRRKFGRAGQQFAMEELDLQKKEKELEMIYKKYQVG